ISIHVRRGDFITNKANPQFIGLDYYKSAINKINKLVNNPLFFVFSNDIPWCKTNLSSLADDIHYINHNKGKDAYKDLLLMSACKHNIVANSTFSWWGAWLNQNSKKIVIDPD
ncbi:MAG: alpha-1,2-fucosyltransferase, partial [bacterium]|nr:alpha-1,2-fucosyltransferase [bacterium]